MLTFSPLISMPVPSELMLAFKSSIYKLNSMLDSEQPCFKQHGTSNYSVRLPFILTAQRTLSYIANRASYINPDIPKSESFVNKIPLLMLSYAFVKSMNATNVFFLYNFLVYIMEVNEIT